MRKQKAVPSGDITIDPVKNPYQLWRDNKHGVLKFNAMFTNEALAVTTGVERGSSKCTVIGPRGTFRIADYITERTKSNRLKIRGVHMPDGSSVMDPATKDNDWEKEITNLRSGLYVK